MSNDKEREALDVAMSRACVKAWDASGYTTGKCDAVHPMFAAAFELGYRASLAASAAPGSSHIKEPYSIAEIEAKIASNDYSAEMLLQHAMLHLRAVAASAGSEPVAWPKDAADVREFVGSHFRSLFYANPTGMDPHENDVYELTAHDLLSAFRWWAELHPSPPEGAGGERALRKVLSVVQRYLPPDGPTAHDAMSEIIAIVDPWPLGPLEKP